MIISESLYKMTKNSVRKIKLRVDLLDFNFRVVGNLEGNTITGSIKIDANADIRRTASLSIMVTDSSFDVGEDRKIWLDKYVQIYVGMLDVKDNIEWINMGIYLIDNPTRTYDAETHTLSFQAYDLMSKMTGLRNGQIPGVPTLIPAGSSIRSSMASAVSQLGGFNNFIIEENPQSVPYDINIETGGYVYDIVSALRDISPNYETFFDINGIFHYQPINAYYSDEIIADDDVFNYVVTNIAQKVDFENVKNSIEVFGKSLDPTRFGNVATVTDPSIEHTFAESIAPIEWTEVTEGTLYSAENDIGFWQISASGYADTYTVDKAFDESTSTAWHSQTLTTALSGLCEIDFPVLVKPSSITARYTRCGSGSVIQGFNPVTSEWEDLASLTSGTTARTDTYDITTNTYYNKFRIAMKRYSTSYTTGYVYSFTIDSGTYKYDDTLYRIKLEDFTYLTPSLTIGFITPANNGVIINPKLQINNFNPIPIVHEDGSGVTITESNTYFVLMNQSKLLDGSGGHSGDYSATASIDKNIYKLTIPSMTTWDRGAIINMTVPSMQLVLNDDKTYTISGTSVPIPNAGEICYVKITGANTAEFVSAGTPTYDLTKVTASGLTYNVALRDTTSFKRNSILRFTAPYIEKSPNIQINNNPACQIYDSTGTEQVQLIQHSNETYLIKIPNENRMLFLGHQQIYGTAEETNPESPFYINKDIGKIHLVLKDGEYNNIYTDELAKQRADYELYLHSRMEDSINLTMVPIYWLDVNQKIYFNEAGINAAYITKNINIDLSATGAMTVDAIKFYPDMASGGPEHNP